MIKRIFKKSRTNQKVKRQKRRRQATLASAREGARAQSFTPAGTPKPNHATYPDIPSDETLLALSRELSGLAQIKVNQAAKERGWATIQRELECHPVRPTAKGRSAVKGASKGAPRGTSLDTGARGPVRLGTGPQSRPASPGSRRWIFGSAAAAVAVVAILLSTYSMGLLTAGPGEGLSSSTTVVSFEGSKVTTPTAGPIPTGSTSETTEGPSTTAPHTSRTPEITAPPKTIAPDPHSSATTTPNAPTPPTTNSNPTGSPATTAPATHTPTSPSTLITQPQTNATTNTTTIAKPQYTAAQRAETAKAAVFDLAALVVDYFLTGDMSGARALVAPGARSQLVQMISALNDPYGFRWVSTKELAADKLRVTLEFTDRVPDGRGELQEVAKRFFLTVRISEASGAPIATVTAISAGS
jgi:hypothetical protein